MLYQFKIVYMPRMTETRIPSIHDHFFTDADVPEPREINGPFTAQSSTFSHAMLHSNVRRPAVVHVCSRKIRSYFR